MFALSTIVLDVDECSGMLHNCHGAADCVNIQGSFECLCQPGFQGNGTLCEGLQQHSKHRYLNGMISIIISKRVSEASDTLSGVYKFELVRYMYGGTCAIIVAHAMHVISMNTDTPPPPIAEAPPVPTQGLLID